MSMKSGIIACECDLNVRSDLSARYASVLIRRITLLQNCLWTRYSALAFTHCGAVYWNCNVGQPRYYHNVKPNQGPYKLHHVLSNQQSTKHLLQGLSLPHTAMVSSIPEFPESRQPEPSQNDHVIMDLSRQRELLEHGRAVIKKLGKDSRVQNAANPIMFHPDLHKRNVFVSEDDPTIITAITDWQSTSIEPAFWDADGVLHFARPISDPSYEDQIEPKSEVRAKAFNVCTQFLLLKLSEPRLMDVSFFRSFRYCCRTWEDGAVVFREELIQTAGRWEELVLVESCPFPLPGPDEYAVHQKDYKLFEAAHELKYSLSDLLDTASDGWTPPEDWEAAKSANQETFTGMLQDVLDNEHPMMMMSRLETKLI
jgi:hypothetical protein